MWELDHDEGWALKNWCFWMWCWRRLSKVPWTARRSNQSILKISTLNIYWKDWCWSWSSSALASWCKELTQWQEPDPGKDWRQKEKGVTEDEMIRYYHQLNVHEFEKIGKDWGAWHASVYGITKNQKQLSTWTTLCYMWFWLPSPKEIDTKNFFSLKYNVKNVFH